MLPINLTLTPPPCTSNHFKVLIPIQSGRSHQVENIDRLCSSGEGHKTIRCRRVTYLESYITKYTSLRTFRVDRDLLHAHNAYNVH